MHYIQKHILDELRTTSSMRYSELNKDNVESGHFRYHLQQLVKDDYIAQEARGVYGLTTHGQQLVDKLSAGRVTMQPMPKVITYTLLRDGDNVILQKKQKQPYLGLWNMIGGKLHEGETSAQAATREVLEKTGQTVETPKLAGVFEVIIRNDESVHTHAIAFVYVANVSATDFKTTTMCAFTLGQLKTETNLAPDFMPIFEQLSTDTTIVNKVIDIRL